MAISGTTNFADANAVAIPSLAAVDRVPVIRPSPAGTWYTTLDDLATYVVGAGGWTDAAAIHDNVSSEIAAITEKVTPVDTDLILIEDSAAGNIKKKVQVGNLPGNDSLSGSDIDAIHDNIASEIAAIAEKAVPVDGDWLIIEDSQDSNNKKRLSVGNLIDLAGDDSLPGGAGAGPVVHILKVWAPGASTYTPDTRDGGSTPAERAVSEDFPSGADAYLDYLCFLQGYDDASGLTFRVVTTTESQTTGTARIGVAIRRMDSLEDFDVAHSYDFNETDVEAPAASGRWTVTTITFTHGTDMDGLVNDEPFILRFRRHGTHANDDLADNVQLLGLIGLQS